MHIFWFICPVSLGCSPSSWDMYVFKEHNYALFPRWVNQLYTGVFALDLYTPTITVNISHVSHSHWYLELINLKNFIQSMFLYRHFIVILVCGSPVMYDFEHLIMIFFCHLYIFFVEIQVFCPFLNRAVRFKSSLCILDNSPFSDVPFGNIFSHSVDCNLFSWQSYAEQKFLILIKS